MQSEDRSNFIQSIHKILVHQTTSGRREGRQHPLQTAHQHVEALHWIVGDLELALVLQQREHIQSSKVSKAVLPRLPGKRIFLMPSMFNWAASMSPSSLYLATIGLSEMSGMSLVRSRLTYSILANAFCCIYMIKLSYQTQRERSHTCICSRRIMRPRSIS